MFGSAFLPWLRSGAAVRSAFGLARSASLLGLFDGWPRRLCLALWFLMPMLVALTWTAAALRRPGWVAAAGACVGSMSVVAGSIVIEAARSEVGPVAAVVTGALTILCAGWLGSTTARMRNSGLVHASERSTS